MSTIEIIGIGIIGAGLITFALIMLYHEDKELFQGE